MAAATPSTGPPDPQFREVQTAFVVLKLVTETRDDALAVRLGPIQRSFREIPYEDIENVTGDTYDAGEYGGWHWGLRVGPTGNTVYRLRGSRGVRVERTDGSVLFVGSQRPEELAAAIEPRLA